MKNKKLISLSMLLLMLFGAVSVSLATAQETDDSVIVDVADGVLIAPAPDEGNVTNEDEQTYNILENRTVADDTYGLEAENGEALISTNTGTDNILAIIAVVVAAVAVVGGAMGIFFHRKNSDRV